MKGLEMRSYTHAEKEVESYRANSVIRKRMYEPGRTQHARYTAKLRWQLP